MDSILLQDNIYMLDGIEEVILLSEEDNISNVKYPIGLTSWFVSSCRLKEKLMKAIPLTEILLESLPNGRYAIFLNNKLHEVVLVENYDKDKILFSNIMPIVGCIGKDEILTSTEYISSLPAHTHVSIILANQITLSSI